MFEINAESMHLLTGFKGNFLTSYLNKPIILNEVTDYELEEVYHLHEKLMEKPLEKSGKHRKKNWSSGWLENRDKFNNGNIEALLPGYVDKFDYFRIDGKFMRGKPGTEIRLQYSLLLGAIEKVISRFKITRIIEFGCGTAHNLVFLGKLYPDINFVASDWTHAYKDIIKLLDKSLQKNISAGPEFDFFNPDYSFNLFKNDLIFTYGALEQVGQDHLEFTDFLISKKIGCVVNIEPEVDLLTNENKFDLTSKSYIEKRGYLNGYLNALRNRESEGKIEILQISRSNIGAFPCDGWSLFIWRPN
jgi:hypothetical protein